MHSCQLSNLVSFLRYHSSSPASLSISGLPLELSISYRLWASPPAHVHCFLVTEVSIISVLVIVAAWKPDAIPLSPNEINVDVRKIRTWQGLLIFPSQKFHLSSSHSLPLNNSQWRVYLSRPPDNISICLEVPKHSCKTIYINSWTSTCVLENIITWTKARRFTFRYSLTSEGEKEFNFTYSYRNT